MIVTNGKNKLVKMIKEKEIQVKVVGRTIKKYLLLGYDCKVGDKIIVKVDDLSNQSHEKITAICDICGAEKEISLFAYNKNYNKYNYYSCNKCKQEKIEKTNKIKYDCKRPIQNSEIRQKLENTNLSLYGNKIASKNTEVIKKLINTNLIRYNEISSAKNEIIKEKAKRTTINNLLKKYEYLNIKDK
jgi:superfamily II helicase